MLLQLSQASPSKLTSIQVKITLKKPFFVKYNDSFSGSFYYLVCKSDKTS